MVLQKNQAVEAGLTGAAKNCGAARTPNKEYVPQGNLSAFSGLILLT